MTISDRDIFDVRIRQQPSIIPESGEMYWGSFRERVRLHERPSLDRPLRLLGWLAGRRTLVKTVHLVQDYAHSQVDEYDHDHYLDSFVEPVDVSVYGSSSAIPANNWPTEEQVSSEKMIKEIELLIDFQNNQDKVLGI